MQKTTTFLNKTDFQELSKQSKDETKMLSQTDATLQKILQFAASYRVQPIDNNQYVEMILN